MWIASHACPLGSGARWWGCIDVRCANMEKLAVARSVGGAVDAGQSTEGSSGDKGLCRDNLRIGIVTPLCPTRLEPYRGRPISQTALALQRKADVEMFYPQAAFPRWRIFQPRKFAYSDVDSRHFPPGLRARHIPYPAFPLLSRPYNGKTCSRYLVPRLKESKPDVILAYWLYPEGYGALLAGEKLGIPVILGARGSDLPAHLDPLTERLLKESLQRASFVLTVSEELRERALRLGAAAGRVRTVRNGLDSAEFPVSGRYSARTALDIDPDAQLALFIGRLHPVKGLEELLQAVGLLVPSHPRLNLILIGEGPLEEKLRSQAAREGFAGRIRFLGQQSQPEVARWIAASDLLCLPSHSEGCPNVVLEALACGRPVVASAVGAVPDLVNSDCGILVPPGDVPRLSEAIREALGRRWDEAVIASQSSRSWDDVAAETYQVCCGVVERHAPAGCGA